MNNELESKSKEVCVTFMDYFNAMNRQFDDIEEVLEEVNIKLKEINNQLNVK